MTTKIEYTAHARRRLQERQIPEAWIAEIIAHGERYRNTQSGREIAVDRRRYQDKERDIMVVFERDGDAITVVT